MGTYSHVILVRLILLSTCLETIECCGLESEAAYCGSYSCHCPNYITCFRNAASFLCGMYCNHVTQPTTSVVDFACRNDNIALGKPASQSGTLSENTPSGTFYYSADLAVDGNLNPFFSSGSCAHPFDSTGQTAVWWRVDLQRNYVVQTVNITNRVGNEGRLMNTSIYVEQQTSSDTPLPCYGLGSIGTVAYVWVKCHYPLRGRYVRLQRHDNAYEKHTMNICEVQVYGYEYQVCYSSTFGAGCEQSCNCQGACDDVTGRCSTLTCSAGFMGTDCQTVCTAGTWGLNCAGRCACDDPSEVCLNTDGHCESGCEEGRNGTGCEIVLPGLHSVPTVSSACASLLVTFGAWSPSDGGDTPDGYWVQRKLYSLSVWTNGANVSHTDALTYTVTQPVIGPHSYYVRVVPYITYNGVQYMGLPSPQTGLVSALPSTSAPPDNPTSTDRPASSTAAQTSMLLNRDVPGSSTDGTAGGLSTGAVAGVSMVPFLLLIGALAIILYIKRHSIIKNIHTDRRPSRSNLVQAGPTDAEKGLDNLVISENVEMTHGTVSNDVPIVVDETTTDKDVLAVNATASVTTPAVIASKPKIPAKKPVVSQVKPLVRTEKPTACEHAAENRSASTPSSPALSRCTMDSTEDLDPAGVNVEDEDHVYGNQSPVGRPIHISELAQYLEQMARRPNAYTMEFKRIPTGNTAKCKVGSSDANKAKNRYANVCAYDHTRVMLDKSDVGESATDYINASYIHGYGEREKAFIAVQGPIMKTREDYWRMIWQTNSNRIVMLTRLVEDGREKCSPYWDDSELLKLGELSVEVLKTEEFAEYTIRLMSLAKQGTTKSVHHFHFTGWPDKGVPLVATSLLEFHRKVRAMDAEARGPLVVQCSAGIGRTGTFIAMDTMLKEAQEDKVIDLFKYVGLMRNSRSNMIQTLDQYIFVYHAVLESVRCGNPIIPCSEMDKAYQGLLMISPDSGKTKLQEQFELLDSLKPDRREEKFAGLEEQNRDRNRSPDIVPSNLVRPVLSTRIVSNTDYINAAYIDGYRSKKAYIVTQLPLPSTVCDVWRLLYDHHCNTLVLLHGIDEQDETTPIYWPTDKDSELTFGPLTIRMLVEKDIEGAATMREFQITHSKKLKSDPWIVRQYELAGWPESDDVPASPGTMLQLMDHVQSWQQRTGNGPIVVQCKYGTRHSGLFLAGSYMLEKLKIDQEVDVFHAVKQIRLARTQLVHSTEQYQFLHTLASSYMKNQEAYANFR